MIEDTLKQVCEDLQVLTKYGIKLERALDLLEAASNDLEEIMAINTLRETANETAEATPSVATPIPVSRASKPSILHSPHAASEAT